MIFQKFYSAEDLALLRELKSRGVKTVVDVCDNYFFNLESPALKARADRLRWMIDLADAITIGTPTLADVTPRPALVVADAIEATPPRRWTRRFIAARRRLRRRRGLPIEIVWFGNYGMPGLPFGPVSLATILPDLEELHRSLPLQLTVISDSLDAFREVARPFPLSIRYVRWTAARCDALLARQDVCILPVVRNAFTEHKSSNRLVHALQRGTPVVATPIPSYREFAPWVSFEGWQAHVAAYALDPTLAQSHVAGGRRHIAREHGAERIVRDWQAVFAAVLGIHG